MVLALLGVWTGVAVVYFQLVDYHVVTGKSGVVSDLNISKHSVNTPVL